MKIGGCVVLYNPGVETLGNVETYRSFFERVNRCGQFNLAQCGIKRDRRFG